MREARIELHAGCSGYVVSVNHRLVCQKCQRVIIDPRELRNPERVELPKPHRVYPTWNREQSW